MTFPYTPTQDTTLYARFSDLIIVGVTGLTNEDGILTLTDGIAGVEAYTTSKEGEKHEECSVCGYKKAPVSIAKLSPSEKSKTGDSSFVWAAILLVSGCALPAMLYIKRRRA